MTPRSAAIRAKDDFGLPAKKYSTEFTTARYQEIIRAEFLFFWNVPGFFFILNVAASGNFTDVTMMNSIMGYLINFAFFLMAWDVFSNNKQKTIGRLVPMLIWLIYSFILTIYLYIHTYYFRVYDKLDICHIFPQGARDGFCSAFHILFLPLFLVTLLHKWYSLVAIHFLYKAYKEIQERNTLKKKIMRKVPKSSLQNLSTHGFERKETIVHDEAIDCLYWQDNVQNVSPIELMKHLRHSPQDSSLWYPEA